MKKISLLLLFYTVLFSASIELKQGWNLIGINSNDAASSLESQVTISKILGGGDGPSKDFRYNKAIAFAASGNFVVGQSYWAFVDADTQLIYNEISTLPASIEIVAGWNFINPLSPINAVDLPVDYPFVERMLSGGNNPNNFIYNSALPIDFASGTTVEGNGYMLKASQGFTMYFAVYNYMATGIGTAPGDVKSQLRINGVPYTFIPYSNIEVSLGSTSGAGATTIAGTVAGKILPAMVISADYDQKNIIFKIYSSTDTFDDTTFVKNTQTFLANGNAVNFGNIALDNVDDFRPINATDSNIELPPVAPSF